MTPHPFPTNLPADNPVGWRLYGNLLFRHAELINIAQNVLDVELSKPDYVAKEEKIYGGNEVFLECFHLQDHIRIVLRMLVQHEAGVRHAVPILRAFPTHSNSWYASACRTFLYAPSISSILDSHGTFNKVMREIAYGTAKAFEKHDENIRDLVGEESSDEDDDNGNDDEDNDNEDNNKKYSVDTTTLATTASGSVGATSTLADSVTPVNSAQVTTTRKVKRKYIDAPNFWMGIGERW